MEYGRSLPLELKAAGDKWTVEGYVSTYGPPADYGNDIVEPSAFDATLASGRSVSFLMNHDMNLIAGVTESLKSDDHGLFGKFKISKTDVGSRLHQWLLDRAVREFSIGYITEDSQVDSQGVRHLLQVALLECSCVTMAMNPRATVTAAKNRRGGQAGDLLRLKMRLAEKRLRRRGIIA